MLNVYDSFAETSRQKQWLERIGEVLERNKEGTIRADETNSFNTQLITELKAIGYHKLPVPASYGGEGATLTDLLLYQERIARTDAPIALAIGWHMITVFQLSLADRWDDEILDQLYDDIVHRGALINKADSEPATGSPSRGGIPQTTARKINDGYLITGRKTFTSLSPVLDYYIVSAFNDDIDAVSEFLIPKGTKGIAIEPTWNMVGMKGTASHDLVMQDVYLPEKAKVYDRLSMPNNVKNTKPNPYLMSIPACYLGIALAARDEAVTFAKSYQPNSLDEPIAYLPHIQQLIGQIELELATARNFMYVTASRWEHREQSGESIPYGHADIGAVKLFAIQSALSVVDKSM